MSEINLEQVKKLAEQLTPEDRLQVFQHLAELPDSLIKPLPRPKEMPSLSEEEQKKIQQLNLSWECRKEDDQVVFYLEGIEVFRASFNAENYAAVFFEKLKSDEVFLRVSDEQRARYYEAVREIVAKEDLTPSDDELREIEPKALLLLGQKLLKDSLLHGANQIGNNLPRVVATILNKITHAGVLVGGNQLRDVLEIPEQKLSVTQIKDALFSRDWEYLKPILGVAPPGGARNVKHAWTDEDRVCLATKYEELQPIWIEAKRIAKDAQKSKERTRKKEWREEVLRAYPHLPTDLLERFSNPRADDAKPADIAVIHAKRECGITDKYSPRHLRDQIRAWKLKTSP